MSRTSSMGGPEDRVLDALVVADLFRSAARQDDALVHDDDAIRVLEDDVHVVLDHHRGDLVRAHDGGDDVHDGRLLPRAHAAGGLVEEEETRLERVGDRHVEELSLALRDAAGEARLLRHQPEEAQGLQRLPPYGPVAIRQRPELPRLSLPGKDGKRDVVEDRQLVEEVDDLEAAGDAGLDAALHGGLGHVFPAEVDRSAVGRKEPADEVDEARLPRAVGADERDDLAFADGEVDRVDGVRLAEVLGELLGLEEVHRAVRLLAAATSIRAVPTIPVGSTSTRTIRITPMKVCQYTVNPTAED